VLDEVPGIGSKRKKTVLRHFPDLAALVRSESSLEDLAKLPGMTKKAAESVVAYLRQTYEDKPEGGV
jgi:excinuclease ABC subunit C